MIPQILLLAACGGAPTAEEPPAAAVGATSGPVTLVYTGRGEGEIEPCG